MEHKYKNSTSIRIEPELKAWLYGRCHRENRSLSNLINTLLKECKDGRETPTFTISGNDLYSTINRGKENTQ